MLTDVQTRILWAVDRYAKRYGYPPTVREIAERVELPTTTVHAHLSEMRRLGVIKRGRGARTITIVVPPKIRRAA